MFWSGRVVALATLAARLSYNKSMSDLLDYFLRISPGLALITIVFLLLPRKQIIARIFLLIFGFILMRDVMTPIGYWTFGIHEQTMWLRFIDDGWLLAILATLSLATCALLLCVKDLRKLVRWGKLSSPSTYLVGIGAGLAVALPFVLLAIPVDISLRGEVAVALLPALLYVALAGNLLEELIFRGFLQSYLERQTTATRAAILSGLLFAVAHIFLASTVTNLGLPLILFVAVEGLVCAFVYKKYGLVSAALTHGLAIFVLASGLF